MPDKITGMLAVTSTAFCHSFIGSVNDPRVDFARG